MDRFMRKIGVDYPTRDEELEIMRRMARTNDRPKVRSVAIDVMRHRIVITYEAEAEQVTAVDIVEHILNTIEGP